MDELSMCIWGESIWAVEAPMSAILRRSGGASRPNARPVADEVEPPERIRLQPLTGGPVIQFEANEVVWFRWPFSERRVPVAVAAGGRSAGCGHRRGGR
jgi:hypothetical protein